MVEAMQDAARMCLHEGETILTAAGDAKDAVAIFEEGFRLYEKVNDQEGAGVMRRRIESANAGSRACAVS